MLYDAEELLHWQQLREKNLAMRQSLELLPLFIHHALCPGSILLDNVACNRNEANIAQCRHRGFNVHNCDHDEDAGVVCSGKDPNSQRSELVLCFFAQY